MWILCTSIITEDVPNFLKNLNIVANLVVPAGLGSCLLRLDILSDAIQA